jgi:hypothetical protein
MSEATQKPRTMLHVQVSGNPSPADLQNIAELFSNAIHDKNGSVVTTPDNVSLTALEVPADQPVVPIQVVSVIGPEVIAEMTYEVNRAYCKGIGDNSFPNDWANADEHQKAVNRAGVQNHLRNPGLTPQQSHQAWMQSKIQDGWTYGPVKDAEKKTHPAMVPYEGLPPEQKTKDFLFKAVVDVLRSRLPAPSLVQREVEVYTRRDPTMGAGQLHGAADQLHLALQGAAGRQVPGTVDALRELHRSWHGVHHRRAAGQVRPRRRGERRRAQERFGADV